MDEPIKVTIFVMGATPVEDLLMSLMLEVRSEPISDSMSRVDIEGDPDSIEIALQMLAGFRV